MPYPNKEIFDFLCEIEERIIEWKPESENAKKWKASFHREIEMEAVYWHGPFNVGE